MGNLVELITKEPDKIDMDQIEEEIELETRKKSTIEKIIEVLEVRLGTQGLGESEGKSEKIEKTIATKTRAAITKNHQDLKKIRATIVEKKDQLNKYRADMEKIEAEKVASNFLESLLDKPGVLDPIAALTANTGIARDTGYRGILLFLNILKLFFGGSEPHRKEKVAAAYDKFYRLDLSAVTSVKNAINTIDGLRRCHDDLCIEKLERLSDLKLIEKVKALIPITQFMEQIKGREME
jgi:predicted DNA-binding ArsR family transcriptional regulator